MYSRFSRAGLGLAAALAAVLLAGPFAAPLLAQTQQPEQAPAEAAPAQPMTPTLPTPETVVAVVNGEEITADEVLRAAEGLPQQYQAQLPLIFPMLVERMVNLKLIGDAGRAAGLADDEEVLRRVREAEADAIRQVYLEQKIEESLTPERLKTAYDAWLVENPPETEVRARHILVEDEAKAQELIKELDGGADFAELAKEHSKGPTGPNGGDLGYFTKDQMLAPFAEKAFALEPGEVAEEPVQTEYGWHVIKVEDRREQPQPSQEEIEPELREQLSRETIETIIAELRAGAEVDIKSGAAPGGDAAPQQ